ncbi:hypothetical protein [Tenacibaculum ovolyticum]|uniref:hypothetical protein n=1 Tax=Tenacibaculum ovolyticum TaxID=104270 RepID=UPI001F25B197|nr:hypothetical protein [Tenacibaculum ovolyticum]
MKYSIQVLKNEIECLEERVSENFSDRNKPFVTYRKPLLVLIKEDIGCLRDCRCALAILQLEDIESKMLGIYVS